MKYIELIGNEDLIPHNNDNINRDLSHQSLSPKSFNPGSDLEWSSDEVEENKV